MQAGAWLFQAKGRVIFSVGVQIYSLNQGREIFSVGV